MLLVIKDPHFRYGLSKPTSRTKNFFNQIDYKLERLIELAKELKVKNLAIAGDVFDVKSPLKYNLLVLKAIEARLEKLKGWFENIYTIAGNHDLPYASIENIKDSVYWYFAQKGYFTDTAFKPISLTPQIDIVGIPYIGEASQTLPELKRLKLRKNTLLMLHIYALPNSSYQIPKLDTATYQELVELLPKEVKGVILGHLHKGFAPQKVNGVVFVNGWAFTRLTRDYYTLNNKHQPEAVLIDDNLNATPFIIPHAPYKEAFTTNILYDKKSIELKDLKESLVNFTINETPPPPKEIKALVEHYLELAKN